MSKTNSKIKSNLNGQKLNDFIVKKAFSYLNKYYYIENNLIDYNNSMRTHNHYKSTPLYDTIKNYLDVNEKSLIYKLSLMNSQEELTNNEQIIINNILEKLKQKVSFKFFPQSLSKEQISLVLDTYKFISDYCFKNDLIIEAKDIFNPIYDCNINKMDLLIFQINYHNFDYTYIIRKIDRRLIFKLKLQRNKLYRINLYQPIDFLNMVNCMYSDN